MAEKSNSKAPNRKSKIVGKYKQVRVVFVGASFLNPEGQVKDKRVDDALGLFILDEVFRRQSILSKLKGLLRKTHHCRKCEAVILERLLRLALCVVRPAVDRQRDCFQMTIANGAPNT